MDDIITIEECITRLDAIRHEIVSNSRDHFALSAGIAALYEMENCAPAVNRWIPCSERLPDHYDDILFCERDRTIHKGYMYWDGTFIEHYVKFEKKDIVAWMSLPEPPEKE